MNKNNVWLCTAALASGLLSGCAHLPDATVRYYLPKSSVAFSVVRTVGCNSENKVFIASAITPTVTHVADRSETRDIPLAKLRGTFSDSDIKVDFYDDGRLKGFNGSSTGEGEAILKTAITVAGAVLAFEGSKDTFEKECKAINTVGGGKPLALTYRIESVELAQTDKDGKLILDAAKKPIPHTADQELTPDPISMIIIDQNELTPAVGRVCVRVSDKIEKPRPRTQYTSGSGDILLNVREPALLMMSVIAGGTKSCGDTSIWHDYVPVAQLGSSYDLPLPRPTTFGKRAFAATFAESGALQSVQFVSNSGAAQALNVVGAAQTATKPDTTAEKASAIKAEADLITQQQRLAGCIAKPAECK